MRARACIHQVFVHTIVPCNTHTHALTQSGYLMKICACVCVRAVAYTRTMPSRQAPLVLLSRTTPPRFTAPRIRDRIWAHVQAHARGANGDNGNGDSSCSLDLWRRCSRECEIPEPSPTDTCDIQAYTPRPMHSWRLSRARWLVQVIRSSTHTHTQRCV